MSDTEQDYTPSYKQIFKKKEIWFSGGGFTISTNGITQTKQSKKGEDYEDLIHDFPVCPVELITSINADKTKSVSVKVRFMTADGEEDTVILPMADLQNPNKQTLLAERGFPMPAGNSKKTAVGEAINKALRYLDLPKIKGYTVCGWQDNLHICPGSEHYTGNTASMLQECGSPDLWKQAISSLCVEAPILSLAMASVYGSFLRGVVPLRSDHSAIFHIFGEHRKGKTTISKILESIRSEAKKGSDSSSSKVGAEHWLSMSNHSYFVLEEIDDTLRKMEGGVSNIMFFANGGKRMLGNREGTGRIGKEWFTTIISTGNVKLTDLVKSDMKAEALGSRVYELDITDPYIHTFKNTQVLNAGMDCLAQNYGHGYKPIIQYITENREDLIEQYNAFYNELTTDESELKHFDTEKRLSEFVCLAQIGAFMMEELISEEAGITANKAIRNLIDSFRNTAAEIEDEEDIKAEGKIEELKKFIADNAQRFRWQGFAYSKTQTKEAQQMQADYLNEEATKYGALGQVVTTRLLENAEDIEGEIFLNKKGKDALKNSGGLDYAELKNAAKKMGLLKTNNDGKDDLKVGRALREMLGDSRVGCIQLKPIIKKVKIQEVITDRAKIAEMELLEFGGNFDISDMAFWAGLEEGEIEDEL